MGNWFLEMPKIDGDWRLDDWVHFVMGNSNKEGVVFAILSRDRLSDGERYYGDMERVGGAKYYVGNKDVDRVFVEVYFFNEDNPRFRFWLNRREFESDNSRIGLAILIQDQWLVRSRGEILQCKLFKEADGRTVIRFALVDQDDPGDFRCVLTIRE